MKDDSGSLYPANSWINAAQRGGFSVEETDEGVKLVNTFKRDGIEIPLYVSLEENSIVLSVNYNEIWEDEEDVMRLLDFEVAPYFGAASSDEKGYIFVPDGSGAVIKFNNRKSEDPYQQYIYGRDSSIIPVKVKNIQETAALPVFGMCRDDAGFLAVVEQDEADSYISAETSGQKTGYNAVSASCIVRDFDTFTFKERTGTPRDIRIFQSRDLESDSGCFSVRYIFLNKSQNSYTGMADVYRKYLQNRNSFPADTYAGRSTLMLNFIGAGTRKMPVCGIPVNVNYPYTPFEDVETVIAKLQSKGVDSVTVKYDGWADGGVLGAYPSRAVPEKNLGGKSGFRKMLAWLTENSIPFYAGADFVDLYRPDLFHIKELAASRAINRAPVEIPEFRLSTFDENTSSDAHPYWIVRTSTAEKWYAGFMEQFSRTYGGTGFAPDSFGTVLSTDFAKKGGCSRGQTAATWYKLLEKASAEGHPLMLSRPDAYALGLLSYAADIPASSSRFEIEDYSVPFYQILLHGYIPFANLSANRTPDSTLYVLGLLESGADPSYLWITRHPEQLRDSRLQSYTNVYADDWLDEASKLYRKVIPVLDSIAGSPVVSHTVFNGGERMTVFENGVRILTNYTGTTVTHDGLTASPYSYAAGR